MIQFRKEQVEALRKTAEAGRRDGLVDRLRDEGMQASADPQTGAVRVQDAAGGTAQIRQGPEGQATITEITTGEGRAFRLEHDAGSKLQAITDPTGFRVGFRRDPKGQVVGIDRGQHSRYQFAYDDKGNLTEVRHPDRTSTSYRYDTAGRPTEVTDRNGNRTRYRYSDMGLICREIDPLANVTGFEYAQLEAPSAMVLPHGPVWEFQYDPDGRLAAMSVNGAAHAKFQTDEQAGTYKVDYADGTKAHFVLKDGRPVEAANETCTVKVEYDDQGRILAEETDGRRVQYLRNEIGALVGLVTPEGEKLTFQRDKEGRVSEVLDWSGQRYQISYGLAGALAGIGYPNGSAIRATASPLGLTASLIVVSPRAAARPLASFQWEYDLCDRVIRETADQDREVRAFRYDKEGRLVEATGPQGVRLELDANGNRIRDAAGACRYNGFNQLTDRAGTPFAYDARGNMVRGACPNGQGSFSYNGQNQLICVEMSAGATKYAYDAFGRRIRKECQGRVTQYTWAGSTLLGEVTTEGGLTTRRDYLMFPGQPVPLALRDGGPGGKVYCLHPGRRSEVLAATDDMGRLVWQADYNADGQAKVILQKTVQPFRLPGQYYDTETGLHYNVERYYNPQLGRYLTIDPLLVDGGSGNFYTYCDGDPMNRLDPVGGFVIPAVLIGVAIAVGVGAAIGAAFGASQRIASNLARGDKWSDGALGAAGRGAIVGAGGGLGAALGFLVGGPVGAVVGGFLAGTATAAAMAAVEAPKGQGWEACKEALIGAVPFVGSGHRYAKNAQDPERGAQLGVDLGFDLLGLALIFLGIRSARQSVRARAWRNTARAGEYPGRRGPSSAAQNRAARPTTDPEWQQGYRRAAQDAKTGDIWDLNNVPDPAKRAALQERLNEFNQGEPGSGQSVRNARLDGKTPEQIHQELTRSGFEHSREPITVGTDPATGKPIYRSVDPGPDGSYTTMNPNDPNLAAMDAYRHPDGGLVRVKPEGDPSGRRAPPHVSKSVLMDPDGNTSWSNEGFKVSEDGNAVPKAPSPGEGMRTIPEQEQKGGYADGEADSGHSYVQY